MGSSRSPSTTSFLNRPSLAGPREKYGFDLRYQSKPNWETYSSLLEFAETVRRDLSDLRPRDMIDIQSFLWVQGSDEYPN